MIICKFPGGDGEGGGGSGGGDSGIVLSSIEITTPPSRIYHSPGELFDSTGMVITAMYSNGAAKVITEYSVIPSTPLEIGTEFVTIQYAEGGVTKTAQQAVTVQLVNPVLNDNTWAEISENSANGMAPNVWSVGDTKNIIINGTVGATTFANLSIDVFILEFNHNAAIEGDKLIHFQIGKIDGVDIALVDNKYGTSMSKGESGYFIMNIAVRVPGGVTTQYTSTNSGGWGSSYMRSSILGSATNPTSPRGLVTLLPSDLRAVMKPCIKYSDNTGKMVHTAACVTATTDYLPLPASFEYHGEIAHANHSEKDFQTQYEYYKTGNSKIKYRHNNTSYAIRAWCRSPYASDEYRFCCLSSSGSGGNTNANSSYALAPLFFV